MARPKIETLRLTPAKTYARSIGIANPNGDFYRKTLPALEAEGKVTVYKDAAGMTYVDAPTPGDVVAHSLSKSAEMIGVGVYTVRGMVRSEKVKTVKKPNTNLAQVFVLAESLPNVY